MIGSLITRALVMVFGYAYPAYECFKSVERNKPEIEQLRFWCQYWILVAMLTVCERIGDTFVSWIPMYSEAKLAFYIYLWYPKTKGTTYVYDSFFKPYVEKHETDIDRNIMELRTRAGDIAVLYFQKAATYGQTRVFDILQYVASQSTPAPRPQQNQPQQGTRATRQPASRVKPQDEEPPSPTSSTTSSQHQREEQEVTSSPPPLPVARNAPRRLVSAPAASNTRLKKTAVQQTDPENPNQSAIKKTTSQPAPENTSQSATDEVDSMQVEPVPTQAENAKPALPPPQPEETAMDEAIRVTRGKLRKTRSTAK